MKITRQESHDLRFGPLPRALSPLPVLILLKIKNFYEKQDTTTNESLQESHTLLLLV